MSIEQLQGRAYEVPFRADQSNVDAFIEAIDEDGSRWVGSAPPSFAGAALFAVAPSFLYDPDVGDYSKVLIHADQTFRWWAPWRVGTEYLVTGSVDRVRMRGSSAWVTFGAVVTDDDDSVLESVSTFVMSPRRPDEAPIERPEPAPHVRADASTGAVRSASRADLIRYAAASRDFNPLHWDHVTARNAGLPGVVVHGLLMASWLMGAATDLIDEADPVPISEARFRFRNPLFAGQAAHLDGGWVEGTLNARFELVSDEGTLVTATFALAG